MGQDPAAIRQDIAQTRAEMSKTVEAVGYKADGHVWQWCVGRSRLAFRYALGRSWAMISTHRSTHSLQM